LHSQIPANEGLPEFVIEHIRPHLEQIVERVKKLKPNWEIAAKAVVQFLKRRPLSPTRFCWIQASIGVGAVDRFFMPTIQGFGRLDWRNSS
jgi:hypothetical protein